MITKSDFKPAWWLTNPHLQTIWPTLFRRHPDISIQRERLELPDGDFIDLDWAKENYRAPIVLVLHGMGGSINSPYAKGILQAIVKHGWRGVFMHFRGCSGEPNRLARCYHSGETSDLSWVVAELQRRHPHVPIAAIGFSMGGNVLLKWLGETGDKNPLAGAVAVSVPFELDKACKRINTGLYRFYQWYLLRDIRHSINKKFKQVKPPFDLGDISRIDNFWTFDDKITAPLHGFANAHEYYKKASARQYLKQIGVPTLVLHAIDDPFLPREGISEENELSANLTLELSDSGGHVGFISGKYPWQPKYWLEERIPQYLSQLLK